MSAVRAALATWRRVPPRVRIRLGLLVGLLSAVVGVQASPPWDGHTIGALLLVLVAAAMLLPGIRDRDAAASGGEHR